MTQARPSGNGRQLKRRSTVMDAAAATFAAKGYHAATTKQIADRLGMRAGSLYYYWASKEAALEEVCRTGSLQYSDNMTAILASKGTAAAQVRAALNQHLSGEKLNYVTCFVFQRRYLPAKAVLELNVMAKLYARQWEELFRRGVRTGEFPKNMDCRLAAFTALSMANGAVAYLEGRGSEAERRALVDTLIETLLHGVLKR